MNSQAGRTRGLQIWKSHVARNEQRHAHTATGNINNWHVAEQINSDVPIFNTVKNANSFLLYIAEQFYVNYTMTHK
jgi:hypothetical protein